MPAQGLSICDNKDNLSAKLRKDWISKTKYRITWRRSVFGVQVPPGFQATVFCCVPGNFEGGKMDTWGFIEPRRRLFKTMKKALEACEKHYKNWEKAIQCPTMRGIKAIFGRKPIGIPKWAYSKLDRGILAVLMDTHVQKFSDEDDDIEYFGLEPDVEPEVEEPEEPEELEEPELDAEPLLQEVELAMGQPLKKRKQRSDKGKPRGKRNCEEPQVYDDTVDALKTATLVIKKQRKRRSDKGQPRFTKKPIDVKTMAKEIKEALKREPRKPQKSENLAIPPSDIVPDLTPMMRSVCGSYQIRNAHRTIQDCKNLIAINEGCPLPKKRGRPKGSKNKVKA